MKGKTLFGIMLLMLMGFGVVSAVSFTTESFTNSAFPDQNAYRITSDIREPG